MLRAGLRAFALALLVAALVAACGGLPASSSTAPSGAMLADAGFKTLTATTEAQKQHLQTLPKGQLTEWQQTGRHYYVYPDVEGNKLYVGTPKEYQAYLALRTKSGLPSPTQGSATTADMASYLKQDAAMQKADAFDRQVPPWAIWPDFANLGWIP